MGLKARPPRVVYQPEEQVEFLNVDVHVESPVDVRPLLRALGRRRLFVLHETREPPFQARFEISGVTKGLEETIERLISIVERLNPEARRLWNACTIRQFDIGIASGLRPWVSTFPLSLPLVERIAAIGAEILITVYGAPTKGGRSCSVDA